MKKWQVGLIALPCAAIAGALAFDARPVYPRLLSPEEAALIEFCREHPDGVPWAIDKAHVRQLQAVQDIFFPESR